MNTAHKSIGKIITFYSYKGGVGRSMALSNVAALLSKWGKKVLIVDFDLEAPGIENYFKKNAYHYSLKGKEYIINKKNIDFEFSKNRKDCPGILDILSSIANGEPDALAKPYALDRFISGHLIDEHGAAGVAH